MWRREGNVNVAGEGENLAVVEEERTWQSGKRECDDITGLWCTFLNEVSDT